MTPEQIASAGTEHAHQSALFCYAQIQSKIDPLWDLLYHIPNGGMYGDDAKSRAIRGNRMKAAGLKPGILDCHLPVARGDFHGLYIEMKKPDQRTKKDGGLSEDQKRMIPLLQAQGYRVIVCYDWNEAATAISDYLKIEDF
jgi:hypothetical protein